MYPPPALWAACSKLCLSRGIIGVCAANPLSPGRRRHPPKTYTRRRRDPPYLTGEDLTHGARLHPVPFAGPSEGLIPRAGFALDLVTLAPDVQGQHPSSKGEHTFMKHVRIATYEIKQGSFQEIAEMAREDMLRTFQEQPGFIRFGLADLGDKTCLSISLWETRKNADAAVPVATRWVRHLGDRVELRSNVIGDLAFYEGVPATV